MVEMKIGRLDKEEEENGATFPKFIFAIDPVTTLLLPYSGFKFRKSWSKVFSSVPM